MVTVEGRVEDERRNRGMFLAEEGASETAAESVFILGKYYD